MGGKASNASDGETTRRGPNPLSGPIRSEKTGSVSQVAPLVRIRNVECPIQVIETPLVAGAGGRKAGSTGTLFGQGTGRRVNRHLRRSRNPRSDVSPG